MRDRETGGKRPGKVEWADRRRPVTRRSGYSVQGTGSSFKQTAVHAVALKPGSRLTIRMSIPAVPAGSIVGFGGWLYVDGQADVNLASPVAKYVLKVFPAPDWGKFGSQWYADGDGSEAALVVTAQTETTVAWMAVEAGLVHHDYLSDAAPALMTNMHAYAPEANFVTQHGSVETVIDGDSRDAPAAEITLKSCNRCARFLPINISNERNHLSFSNHCVAAKRRPCSHSSFGRLREADDGDRVLTLEYGFQLECRFCKKFEVNAAHNPQRTAAQMKEDAQRRRAFEALLAELYKASPALLYRKETGGRELADDVFDRFGRRCFKCGVELASPRDMELDHTRPLALLWPLDGTATALCPVHNSEKRDRPPAEYYDEDELRRLAAITGLSDAELADPSPNMSAISLLVDRLDWLLSEFLLKPEMQEVHDGKRPADLLVKALQKVLDRAGVAIDLAGEQRRRVPSTST